MGLQEMQSRGGGGRLGGEGAAAGGIVFSAVSEGQSRLLWGEA